MAIPVGEVSVGEPLTQCSHGQCQKQNNGRLAPLSQVHIRIRRLPVGMAGNVRSAA
jgi:hypothetical protein